jgi:putative SOS response-associated peptidase YedK
MAIIVTEANELMRPIHDRMPVILDPESFGPWLETPAPEALELLALLRPAPTDGLEAYPVSTDNIR